MDFAYINPGDHIKYSCGAYDHHGIYCGDVPYENKLYKDVVIHFEGKHKGETVKGISYQKFAKGHEIYVPQYQVISCYAPDVVVRTAISMLTKSGYDLFSNNCEYFAHWCKTGEKVSGQVNRVKWVAGTLGVASLVIFLELIAIGIGMGAAYTGEKFISGLFKV